LRILTGHIRQSDGEVLLFGQPVWGNADVLRRIGVCPDVDNFYEDMSGLEFVTLCAKLSGIPEGSAKKRSNELLDRLNLSTDDRKRRIRGYSKGMRQRVKLAQALVHDPDLLFLDEPMTGLDPVARHEVSEILKDLAKVGKSVLVSSHILHEIESMTEQLLLISHGRLLAEGDVHEIRESLEDHPYVIKIRCSEPRRLAEVFVSRGWVNATEVDDAPEESSLIVRTNFAGKVFEELPSISLDRGIKIFEITSPDDNIEAVFEYLTEL
jgi:ABC-2 type transport system ATP-binding protein